MDSYNRSKSGSTIPNTFILTYVRVRVSAILISNIIPPLIMFIYPNVSSVLHMPARSCVAVEKTLNLINSDMPNSSHEETTGGLLRRVSKSKNS